MPGANDHVSDAAKLFVRCLENEGVTVVFGLPGEENVHLTQALERSSIRYVLTRHEQAASFMAEMWGRVTGSAGVVSSTLGPGAINLQLGVADAMTNSTPIVALSAQVGHDRNFKESHQFVDLVSLFAPITKWSASVPNSAAIPEMVRKAFKTAETERPGAVYLAVPEDVEDAAADADLRPLPRNVPQPEAPAPHQIQRAVELIRQAEHPIVLAGHGAARGNASEALISFAESLGVPVATTFHGKGVFPDDHPRSVGTIGFMSRDYANFGFEKSDLIICVGYELQEFDPVRVNPEGDKRIVHVHRFPAEVDAHYSVDVGVIADLSASLNALREALGDFQCPISERSRSSVLLDEELEHGRQDDSYPLTPQRIVADTRAALGRDDIALVDTGAVKMWMARLYPTYSPNTCLISNGLSTMGFALPGALAVSLARPDAKVLAVVGDGAWLMHSQEIETATREGIPLTVLIWEDNGYGLIEWKMQMELGEHSNTAFGNPDVVKYAESFGASGYQITSADELLPTLRTALDSPGVSIINCPVDYRENLRLIGRLGQLDAAL
ncbi:MAG TPA: acetolactate synthase large subunit [Jiangellaceae bacterium]